MDESMIQIPIMEYENFRNSLMVHDKSALIKDLHKLLQERDTDLRRYKEKYEHTQNILQRTQKQLDKCMTQEQLKSLPHKPVAIKIKKQDSEEVLSRGPAPEVIARACDDNKPVEHDETTSLPLRNSRHFNSIGSSSHLKSMPAVLTNIGSPGMSAALLQRLVQENVRMRQELGLKSSRKHDKFPEDAENIISELKLKVSRQQQQIEELLNRSTVSTSVSSSNITADTSSLYAQINKLQQQIKDYEKKLELDKVVISSLKVQKDEVTKARDSMEELVEKFRALQTSSLENNEEKIAKLKKELEESKQSRENLTSKFEEATQELNELRKQLEQAEQDRDIFKQNYTVLCSQRASSAQSYNTTPQQHFMAQASGAPTSLYPARSYADTSAAFIHPVSQLYHQPTLPPRQSATTTAGSGSLGREREPPLPPRMSQSMSHSMVQTPSTTSYNQPPPRERKTFKCPRCEQVFDVLGHYRDHIKLCLKSP